MDDDQAPGAQHAEYTYWAFISYSSTDKSWARWLQRAIESYGIPARLVDHLTPTGEPAPKRLKPLFRDRSELPAAADLGTQIEAALRASRYLIVVCSPRAARSPWVNKEVETFQALGRPGRVLTLIVEGEPNTGGDDECFPAALRETEPLAADARPQGDGRRDARLKLLSGMLGVGFDALKQRDSHRRIRRLQTVIAAVLALAVGFAGLSAYAVMQRNTAREQRDKAVRARQEAEKILEVLLYDVRDLLRPLGRLDVVEEVQAKVDDYYRQLGTEAGISVTLLNRAAAFNGKGDRLMAQGDLEAALRQYRAGMEVTTRLTSSQPDNVLWQRNLAVSHELIGRALEEQRELPEALRHYQAALAIARRVAATDPTDTDYQRELSLAYTQVGDVLKWQMRLDEALQHYQTALDIAQRAHDSDPGDTQLQDDLVVDHANIGVVLETQNDLDGALSHYRAALRIDEGLAATDPLNTRWQQNVAWDHNDIAVVLAKQHDLDGALGHYRAALAIKRRLAAWDPANTEWQRAVAVTLRNLGGALAEKGEPRAALRHLRAALDIDERLAAKDPTDAVARQDIETDRAAIAILAQGSGEGR